MGSVEISCEPSVRIAESDLKGAAALNDAVWKHLRDDGVGHRGARVDVSLAQAIYPLYCEVEIPPAVRRLRHHGLPAGAYGSRYGLGGYALVVCHVVSIGTVNHLDALGQGLPDSPRGGDVHPRRVGRCEPVHRDGGFSEEVRPGSHEGHACGIGVVLFGEAVRQLQRVDWDDTATSEVPVVCRCDRLSAWIYALEMAINWSRMEIAF